MKRFYPKRLWLLLIFVCVFLKNSTAQNFHLVKDINAATDSNPMSVSFYSYDKGREYAVLNGVVYFNADDGLHGKGLWRSDGSTVGTYQIKESVNPIDLKVSNGVLYFAGAGNSGLWKSDGTEAGTVRVLETLPEGMSTFTPSGLTDLNGILFFVIRGDQLWKSDGTAAGTVPVKNFYNSDAEKSLTSLTNLTVVKNKIYFAGLSFAPYFTFKLAVSDGTTSGSHVVANTATDLLQIVAGTSDDADPSVYFTAPDPNSGKRILFVTNGDSGNATIAPGFNGFIASSNEKIVNIGGVIYFVGSADISTKGQNLYKFDIKAANGIQPLKIVGGSSPSSANSSVFNLYGHHNTLFFGVYDASNNKLPFQLWKSNGTSEGNVLLKDGLRPNKFVDAGGSFYFSGSIASTGEELWKTDGSVGGTAIIKDINSGVNASNPSYLTYSNGKVFFGAQDGVHGTELWISDGTANGTLLVKDINQTTTSSSNPNGLQSFKNNLFFSAYDGKAAQGNKVFLSDGTNSGTMTINDTIFTHTDYSYLISCVKNNETFFWGKSISGRQGLYKTNGSSAGTILVKDFTDVPINIVNNLVATDSLIYFTAYNRSSLLYELWRSDGTDANTFVILSQSGHAIDLGTFASAANITYFKAKQGELWKTDGTIAGTALLKKFVYDISLFTVYKGLLFFSASDDTYFNRLWKSDGTEAGTIKVTNKVPINYLLSSDNQLFIEGGGGLYRSDGTETGTVFVKGIQLARHPKPVNIKDTIYFFNYQDLWKSDGTPEGTLFITRVDGYKEDSYFVTCNGKLFFLVDDLEKYRTKVLWESDGTEAGTHTVIDNIFSGLNGSYRNLTSAGNQLYFTASTSKYGEELYAGTISKPGVTYYISVANGNWNDPATWAGNVVPPEAASVIIRHNVVGNVNASCRELRVEEPGNFTMNAGVKITMVK